LFSLYPNLKISRFLRLIHSCHQSFNLPASDAIFQLYKNLANRLKSDYNSRNYDDQPEHSFFQYLHVYAAEGAVRRGVLALIHFRHNLNSGCAL
jgi:hypothetical protein